MRSKNILEMLKLALRRILSGRPCLFAECSCGLRGPMYVGELDTQHAVELEVSGRTPEVRTKVELEKFLEELRDTILGSFRLD